LSAPSEQDNREIYSYFELYFYRKSFQRAKLLKKIGIKRFLLQNISYFCIVKHLKEDFCTFLGIILMILPLKAMAQDSIQAHAMDSVEVSLLTCSPHEEIYSLYGHTALRWHDLRNGDDFAFNWGVFDFKKPYFVLRFVFGLTDYELGAIPMTYFMAEYRSVGSSVTEQVLDLTADEKQKLLQSLINNLKPENRIYRYNYFYDNCSTRPRDIIEQSVNGKVKYAEREDFTPSYREIISICTRNHPWATFGNDMLLGVKADLATDRRQQEFLPEYLLYDFDRARIDADGTYRPLVKERRTIVPSGVQVIEPDFLFSPTECASALLILSIVILAFEWRRKKTFRVWDCLLMVAQGLVGLVLFVMLFSQHPTTSTNLQLLLFNPLPFAFLPAVIRGRSTRWWLLFVVLYVLFMIGSLFQHYAEGMIIVALCLLLRSVIHFKLKA
jgi:hypothetical protein